MKVYKENASPILRKFSIFLILFSILFIFLAFIPFIEELKQYFEGNKIVVCLIIAILDILFYALGAYGKVKWPEKSFSNECMLFLGVLFTPCTILMFFTVLKEGEIEFNITASYFFYVALTSYIIYAVLGILLKSKLTWCSSLLTLEYLIIHSIINKISYLCLSDGLGCSVATWLVILFPMLFGSFLIVASLLLAKPQFKIAFTSRATFFVGLFNISIGSLQLLMGDYSHELRLFGLLIFTADTLIAIYYGIKYNDSVVCNFGVTFFIINVYVRFFEYCFDYLNSSAFFAILGISLWVIAIKADKIFNINSIYNSSLHTKKCNKVG